MLYYFYDRKLTKFQGKLIVNTAILYGVLLMGHMSNKFTYTSYDII